MRSSRRYKALLQYLEKRGITETLAKLYLKEAYYRVNEKQYFALAFENHSKGYELRNEYFKRCTGSKDATFVRGVNCLDSELFIFEGFMDFLSYLTITSEPVPIANTVILNSLTQLDKYFKGIAKYERIHC